MKDFQRQKVYNWEKRFLPSKHLSFDEAQSYVNRVWEDMGLKYPPTIHRLAKNAHTKIATANRLDINIRENGVSEAVLLHEMAHSMTTDIDGLGHQHNEYFVGMYMVLLEKYLGISPFLLWYSAEKEGVKYVKNMTPRCGVVG